MEPSNPSNSPMNRISEWLKEVNEQTVPVSDKGSSFGPENTFHIVHTSSPPSPIPLPHTRSIGSNFSSHLPNNSSVQKQTHHSKRSLHGQTLSPKGTSLHSAHVMSANSRTESTDRKAICSGISSANRKPIPLLARSQSAISSVFLIPSKATLNVKPESRDNKSSTGLHVQKDRVQSKSSPSSPNRQLLYKKDITPLTQTKSENDVYAAVWSQGTSSKCASHMISSLKTERTHFALSKETEEPIESLKYHHSACQEPMPTDTKLPPKKLLERDLINLSHLVGDRLPFLTVELGLELSEWDYACKSFKLPDTQALYVLRNWYGMAERTIDELCNVLEACDMLDYAEWLRKGELKDHVKDKQLLSKTKPHTHKSFLGGARNKGYSVEEISPMAAYPERKTTIQKGFSLQSEDGEVKLVVSQEPLADDGPASSHIELVLHQSKQNPPLDRTVHNQQPLRAEIKWLSLSENSLLHLKEQHFEDSDMKKTDT